MARLRILVVDDTPHVRRMLVTLLSDDGHDVVAAAGSAAEAETAVEQHAPDVVILDHRMPGVRGVEFARQVLALHSRCEVIIYSAFIEPDVEADAAAAGVTACLAKVDGYGALATQLDLIARRRAGLA